MKLATSLLPYLTADRVRITLFGTATGKTALHTQAAMKLASLTPAKPLSNSRQSDLILTLFDTPTGKIAFMQSQVDLGLLIPIHRGY